MTVTLADILGTYPDAMWSDGTLWYESETMLETWDLNALDHPARMDGNTVFMLNPVTGIALGGFALLKVSP